MSKYNPAFWEVNVDPVILESVLIAPGLLAQPLATPEDERASREREQARDRAVEIIRELIHTRLTPDQRRIVDLYFYQGKTQAQIAGELHISQQLGTSLAQMPQYRVDILFGLLRLDLSERVEELLREFVAQGSKSSRHAHPGPLRLPRGPHRRL